MFLANVAEGRKGMGCWHIIGMVYSWGQTLKFRSRRTLHPRSLRRPVNFQSVLNGKLPAT